MLKLQAKLQHLWIRCLAWDIDKYLSERNIVNTQAVLMTRGILNGPYEVALVFDRKSKFLNGPDWEG